MGLSAAFMTALASSAAPSPAVGPVAGHDRVHGAGLDGGFLDDSPFGFGVRGKGVDGHDGGDAELADDAEVGYQVGDAFLYQFHVLLDIFLGKRSCLVMTLGPPPCIFRARTVATTTTASGKIPLVRHLMSTNFSKPMSAPKPLSVTT